MLPREWGAGVPWMELHVQQHAAHVCFRYIGGQSRNTCTELLDSDSRRQTNECKLVSVSIG